MRHGMDAFIVREEKIKAKPTTPKKATKDDPLIEVEATDAPAQPPAEAPPKPAVKTRKVICPPDIHRVLYRPWLYMGTPAGKKLDR